MILSGEEIIHEVKKYTGDLRTGFGSFIEKNLAPFSSAYPENNCRKKDIKCDQPYSFIHKVNMIWCKSGLGVILFINISKCLLIIKFHSFDTPPHADRFVRLDGTWVQGRCTFCNSWGQYRLSGVDIRCLDASDGRSELSYYHWKLITSNFKNLCKQCKHI